jgi:hypothetical protein
LTLSWKGAAYSPGHRLGASLIASGSVPVPPLGRFVLFVGAV